MKRLALALTLTLLGACGSVSVVEVPPDQMPPPPPPPPTATVQVQVATASPTVMRAGENWIGRYECAQGATDLDLRIDAVNGDQIDATFLFAHGPSGAAGSYRLRGMLAPDGNLVLTPGAWIARPPNYVSVGMSGVVRNGIYRGRIDNPSCGLFAVRRMVDQ